MSKKPSTVTQEQVNESLNYAIANGYELYDWTASEIADDLSDYDSTFEGVDPKDLVLLIEVWLALPRRRSV